MANKKLFRSKGIEKSVPKTNTVNEAGGRAYKFESKHALAQYVVTGTFGNTYYTSGKEQLNEVEKLVAKCDSKFLGKLALYGREIAKMKDTPAYLLACLTARGELELVSAIFDRVCDNSKMLFNYVQIIRSGAVGRRSFGSRPKKLIQRWIKSKSPMKLYLASLGHADPSMADVIKMVRPRPDSLAQQTMFNYLTGLQRERGLQADWDALPEQIKVFEALKAGETTEIPDVPFRALTNCDLSVAQWRKIARNMPWNTLRMNLNMLARKGVFENRADTFIKDIVKTLSDPEEVRRCNAFPYQLLTTYQNVSNIPMKVKNAIQDAMEIATENVPEFKGRTVVAIDTSGSMTCPITGYRQNSSVTRCVDVASLIAACVLRNNEDSIILGFDTRLFDFQLNPRDSVMTNARIIGSKGGGGTNCSVPLQYLNHEKIKLDNFIMVSDNQSWSGVWGHGQGYMTQWAILKQRCPNAKLVNIDIQPYGSTQSPDKSKEVLNIGGFSDVVFTVMDEFFNRDADTNFVKVIEEAVEIGDPQMV